jgi:hypothetical protein
MEHRHDLSHEHSWYNRIQESYKSGAEIHQNQLKVQYS